MISKNEIKSIKALAVKKIRQEKGLFIAESHKLVEELLGVMECTLVVATEEWVNKNSRSVKNIRTEIVSETVLKQISLLQTPQDVLAVFRIPNHQSSIEIAEKELVLALDNIQDPGNLGTIVRIADWFGIKNIFCSIGTADIYNPKSIQATMGAIARVKLHYMDLQKELGKLKKKIPVYGTLLNGKDIYKSVLTENGIIIMGNEGNGISKEVCSHVTDPLYIPSYPADAPTSESLNVAVATAITCAEFRRRTYL
ncbi:MAG: RNA methyltransferase [Bacteroidaceae bacterium]|nr:RNA methyltransferase [Bacteroidaceae bacterium]